MTGILPPIQIIPLNHLLSICLKHPSSIEDHAVIRRLYPVVGDAVLWRASKLNKVEAAVAEALSSALDGDIPDYWKDAYQSSARKMALYFDELDRVVSALNLIGVKILVLENGALARAIISSPARFSFGDFDLLIHPAQFEYVHRELLNHGYFCHTSAKDDGMLDYSNGRLVYETDLQGYPLWLNIQNTFVARRWVKPWQEPEIDILFSEAVSVPDSEVLILNPETFLLQLCIHNASHGFIQKPGIRLHLDVDWYLRSITIQWERFVKLVRLYRVSVIVYVSLAIPKAIWNTPIPDSVMESIRPSPVRERQITKMLKPYDLFDPDQRKFSRRAYITFNALLYDDARSLFRAMFPDRAFMKERYRANDNFSLMRAHVKRLFDLSFRRVNT